MTIDSIEWHQGSDLPSDLPSDAAGTHIGIFLAWIIINGHAGEKHAEDNGDALDSVYDRKITGSAFLRKQCNGELNDDDLDQDGQRFAKYYYAADADGSSPYLEDYERTLAAGLPSIYHVQDVWENYDLLVPVMDAAYECWRTNEKAGA